MEIPWLALAIVITHSSHATGHIDSSRSRRLIQADFERYSTEPVSDTPMWNLLVRLSEKAELDQVHTKAVNAPGVPVSVADLEDPLLDSDQWMSEQQFQYDLMPFDEQMAGQEVQYMPWLGNEMQ